MARDPEQERKMAHLEARIAAAKQAHQVPKSRSDTQYSQAALAWQMVTELVAGLVIGFGIGYGLDILLGTMPLFLVLFVLLGFAAGVKTMLRTSRGVQTEDTAGGEVAGDEDERG